MKSYFITGARGPNVSSLEQSMSCLTPVIIVGSKKLLFGPSLFPPETIAAPFETASLTCCSTWKENTQSDIYLFINYSNPTPIHHPLVSSAHITIIFHTSLSCAFLFRIYISSLINYYKYFNTRLRQFLRIEKTKDVIETKLQHWKEELKNYWIVTLKFTHFL